MEFYSSGAGIWNSVFAVPSEVVDKYIKLAGAVQLKVLLWLLRNNCRQEKITAEIIATALNMSPIDVKDCMEFWISVGVLSKYNDLGNELEVAEIEQENVVIPPTQFKPKEYNIMQSISKKAESVVNEVKAEMESYTPPSRTMTRPSKPDSVEVAQRLAQDDDYAVLIGEAEKVLARPLTNNDTATLLLLHDNDGLPYEVITMLLYFAKSENKLNMKYIESVGREWGDAGIDTLEKAEEKMAEITASKECWAIARSAFGFKGNTTPTRKQIEYAETWIKKWGFDEIMLRLAYENCVNSRGEVNLSYINGILRNWHSDGVVTEKDLADRKWDGEQVKLQPNQSVNKKVQPYNKAQKLSKTETSYNIDAFKEFDIFE